MTIVTLIFIFLVTGIFVFFKKFSNLINVYDIPDDRKLHKGKISLAGGVYLADDAFIERMYTLGEQT